MRTTREIYDSQRFDISKPSYLYMKTRATQTETFKDIKKHDEKHEEEITEAIREEIEDLRESLGEKHEEVTETLEDIIGCIHLLSKGKYKGSICGKRVITESVCKRHYKK